MPCRAAAELVEDAVAIRLFHLGVDVEAAVAELGDLLREQLDAVDRVAEDNALVDVELRKESVQAVNLLPLLHEGVELSDSAQSEFVHEVDDVGVGEELVLEPLHCHGEGSRKKKDLAVRKSSPDERFEHDLELRAEKLVRLFIM